MQTSNENPYKLNSRVFAAAVLKSADRLPVRLGSKGAERRQLMMRASLNPCAGWGACSAPLRLDGPPPDVYSLDGALWANAQPFGLKGINWCVRPVDTPPAHPQTRPQPSSPANQHSP